MRKKSNLNEHMSAIHKKKNTFKCENCYKYFTMKGNLKSHKVLCKRKLFAISKKVIKLSSVQEIFESKERIQSKLKGLHFNASLVQNVLKIKDN